MSATGYTSGDPNKVDVAGDAMTGPLVVNETAGSLTYPLGRTGSLSTGLNILSKFGGEDDGTGTDTTGRINLYSFQRAQNVSFGEIMRIFLMRSDAKGMIAWYMPTAEPPYNASTEVPNEAQGWNPVAWVGAHYEANDNLSIHGHWSIEVPDSTNALQTRLEIPFVDQEGDTNVIGVDTTNIRTHNADFTVSADSGVLRVGGGDAYNKDILLSHSSGRSALGERWKLRADNTAESGSNVGTDFSIRRHSDNGTFLDTALFIKRSTGNIAIAGTSTSTARVTANWGTTGQHGFNAVTTGAIGNAAAFATTLTATTERVVDARISGDSNARFVILGDGKHEFGDGTTRDVNLYRSAADVLKTDDSLHVTTRLSIGQAPDTTIKVVVTQTADANAWYSQNTNVSGNTNQPHLRMDSATNTSLMFASRVAGDATSRFVQRIDGQMQFGDGTNARDVNLYRNAADQLKTDDMLIAGAGIGVGNSAAATTPGSVVRKIQVFDASGSSLGFLPVYSAIT